MISWILKQFKGDRKYFSIVFFILIALFISGLLTPIIVQKQADNWLSSLSSKTADIEAKITREFKQIEGSLLYVKRSLKHELNHLLLKNVSYGEIVKLVNDKKYADFSVEVLAPNGKLIAWNSLIAVPQEDIFPLNYPLGESYFFRSELITYLTTTDTVSSENDIFYLICSLPFEKHYFIQNNFFKEISFSRYISNTYQVQAEISFSPIDSKTKDGRKYSFDLLNNEHNKIGQITISKPTLDLSVSLTTAFIEKIQSILVIAAIIFFGLGLRREYKLIENYLYKIFLLIVYLSFSRYLMYLLNFPGNLLPEKLSDPSFFSSAFAGGIVRSPIEFFVTASLLLILCITIYQHVVIIVYSNKLSTSKFNFLFTIVALLLLSVIFFLGLRGLSASLRSVIFDSTLRYFRDAAILPDTPAILMNINVLLLGTSIVLILTAIVIFLSWQIKNIGKLNVYRKYFLLFLFFQIEGIIFISVQKQPLIDYFIMAVVVTLIFILSYHIYFKLKKSKYAYVYAALLGSVISIIQLNHFNFELERESLKTIAVEINRPSDNLIRFMISEILLNNPKLEQTFKNNGSSLTNFTAEAFAVWSMSSLSREAFNSSISFYDVNGSLLGEFWNGLKIETPDIKSLINIVKKDPVIFDNQSANYNSVKIITGLAPILRENKKLGYITVSVLWDPISLENISTPEYLRSSASAKNSVLDLKLLNIFEFSGSKLVNVYGDIYPSRDQLNPIVNADFEDNIDVWFTINLNGENYTIYALKHESNKSKNITAVAFPEKKISWNLFNFFKLFIMQSIFIIIFLAALLVSDIRKFRYTFRFQLTIVFLLISILPVIILAVFNRNLVEKQSNEIVKNELSERLEYVEHHIQSSLQAGTNKQLIEIFEQTSRDLGISFSVFDNMNQIFSSNEQYYKAGILPARINPIVYYNLNYLSFREYVVKESIENYSYNSLFKKVTFNSKNYILAVNDLFNKVKLYFSTSDIDVLLFGVYLLAAVIIILISTMLAERISLPIRKLTKATVSVAQGDLSIVLKNKEKGELRDLFDGFNLMTEELKKNQRELAELERESAWKEMAKQVAHEIKNPLTPMKLSIQQLIASFITKNKNFEEIFSKVSQTILNQIDSLNQIASEFSRFAKMPSYKIEAVDLRNLIADVINLFSDETITILNEVKYDIPKINADNSQVRRLLINLIRNSIQSHASTITLSSKIENDFCCLLVEDDGSGIPLEIKDKIFEQNFTTKAGGMGLGLKLAKRFLTGIGGDIQLVESEKRGTTFKVTFPIYKK